MRININLFLVLSCVISAGFFGEFFSTKVSADDSINRKNEIPAQSTIESEEARLQSLIGTRPTVKSIHDLFGNPDVIYKGESSYQSELFYGKVSTKVNLVVYEMEGDSIRILYVRKQPDGS